MGSDALAKSTAFRPGWWQRHPTVSCLLGVWGLATLYLIHVAISATQSQQTAVVARHDGAVVRSAVGQTQLGEGRQALRGPDTGLSPASARRKRGSRKGWVEVPLDTLKEMQSKYSASGRKPGDQMPAGPQLWAAEGHQASGQAGGEGHPDEPGADGQPETPRPGKPSAVGVGERYEVPPHLAHMQSNDSVRGRYMDIVLHKGFTNQVFALLNGLAIAHLLNVTLVLPEMTANYDYKVYSGMDIQRMQFDPAQKFRQRMDNFFDTAALRAAVAPWTRVVDELPTYLQGDSQFGRIPATLVNPKRPETLLPYLNELKDKLVLRVKCPLSSVLWNIPELGRLRRAAVAALAPSGQVAQMVSSRMEVIRRASAGWVTPGFIGLHLRVEADWIEHCKSERLNPAKTMIESFEQCWASAEEVSSRLVHAVQQTRQAEPRLVYVATGQYDQDFEPFQRRGFTVLSPANFSNELDTFRYEDGQTMRDLLAAVDYFILRSSTLFMGNMFSSFSFSIRENFFYRESPSEESLRAFYYNDKKPYPLLDITPVEALRWRVRTGIAYPEFYTDSPQGQAYTNLVCKTNANEISASASSTENSAVCGAPKLSSLTVTSVTTTDSGYVVVAGKVESKGGMPWIFTLEVQGAADGAIPTIANEPVYKMSPDEYKFEFSFAGTPDKQNEFVICTLDGAESECTNPQSILLKSALKRPHTIPFGSGGGTVFIYTGMSRGSGGVESLHKLNAVINSEYAKGHITVQSKLQNGHSNYRTETSQYVDDVTSRDVGPNDVFIIPERLDNLPRWWHYVLEETGALPSQYILGQHTTKLRVDRIGKDGFQPICLTHYFATTHDCPPKAVLTTAFDDSWIQSGRKFRNSYHAKENIILVDPDNTMHLDPLRIQVPGARVVLLKDMSKEEVQDYYRRAKINIDTYLTGRERALFEGALFNVIPIIKYHSSGIDHKTFNVPEEWRWHTWNYDELNHQLAHLLHNYREQVPQLQPLIQTVEGWVEKFPQQVSRYFGDNVHIMLSALGDSCDMDHEHRTTAMVSAVFILLQYPFATVEILTNSVYYFEYDFAGVMDLLFRRGMERRLTISQVAPEYRRLCSVAVFLQPPKAKQRRRTALIVPAGSLPLEADLLTSLLKAHSSPDCGWYSHAACQLDGVAVEGGLLLVEQASYYHAVDRLLERVPDQASVARLRPYLEQMPITIREIPVSELPFFAKYDRRCTKYPLCSGAMDMPPWDLTELRAMDPACLQSCVCDNIAPILHVQTMASTLLMFQSSNVYSTLTDIGKLCSSLTQNLR